MANVKIVSSAFPTAGELLPDDADGLTLGPVVIVESGLYDAIMDSANAQFTAADLLTNPTVSRDFLFGVSLLIHEFVHVKQYRELGQNTFFQSYGFAAIGDQLGLGNGFENEAYAYEAGLIQLQGGRWCTEMKDSVNGWLTSFGVPASPVTCN